MPLAHLSRQACGSLSETLARICSRSFKRVRRPETHFLVRAGKSRRVEVCEEEISSSLTQARAFPSQASRPFEIPARHGHPARSTQLQLAFGQMTLLPPRNAPRASKEPLTVWVIRVWEEKAPEGEEPLEWLLLTSVPTTTLEDAWERVGWCSEVEGVALPGPDLPYLVSDTQFHRPVQAVDLGADPQTVVRG